MADHPMQQRLSLSHIAFYRAWMEGTMDLGDLAVRYLDTGKDLPAAKRTLKGIEHSLITACRRAGKPANARLIRLNTARLRALAGATQEASVPPDDKPNAKAPTFEQYQAEVDPYGDWSYNELYDQYLSTYGAALPAEDRSESKRAERAAKLIARRNALIIELEKTLAEDPQPDHDIRGWLDESLSNHLAAAGLLTIRSVIDHANENGYYWHRSIPRLGRVKASRVQDFLKRYESKIGLGLSPFATTPAHQLPKLSKGSRPAHLIVTSSNTSPHFAPVENGLYIPPEELDGSQGINRAPLDKNRSGARNDYEAIQRWLATFDQPHQEHTQRNYRKEAERLLLWTVMQKGMPLSSMTTSDVVDFRAFLADPQPYEKWVSERTYERYQPEWRPFVWRRPPRSRRKLPGATGAGNEERQAGLSPASISQSLSVCRALCSWLMSQRYLDYNPFSGISKRKPTLHVNTGRSFTRRQWALVMQVLHGLDPKDPRTQRLRFALHLAYSTGLRLSEMTQATTDCVTVEEDLGGDTPDAFFLTVTGKGNQKRSVPLTNSARQALADYLQSRGLSADPRLCEPGTPLIAKLYQTKQGWSLTPAALYKIFSDFFSFVGTQLPDGPRRETDHRRFFQASTHWLRHTHGTHALAYGADLNIVKENMGHKSLTTTSLYVKPEKRLQLEQMEAFDRASSSHTLPDSSTPAT